MSHASQTDDRQLTTNDIGQLENADEIALFFAKLGYDIDPRTALADYAVIGLGSDYFRQHINRLEQIGRDPNDGDIVIYLLEVRSITAKLRHEIARRFRDRPENALLVLTTDYNEIEFVLLDRSISHSGGRGLGIKQIVRPIPLTVQRRNPEALALRVLKRFSFTEADAGYQWEKLRSAYRLAESSEEYFNNRALFSDYYLKQRLADAKLTPEWAEDVRPIGRAVHGQISDARAKYAGQPAATIRSGLFEPLFTQLGFSYAEPAHDSAASRPDYLLYAPGESAKPIAAALAYVWNRNLDDADETRDSAGDPQAIPGAQVVSLLESQVAPWVIVTNGKLWRLYSTTASNKATNYYEVDLEEALAASDQTTAMKYWWLLFRRQAFTGFLDTLLKHSAEYAKELGARLKDRVFTEIFPQFAKGFLANARVGATPVPLDLVFAGTMTFLYRLMFVLYAESLDLLPVQEARGYQELSMQRLKREIANAGGSLRDEATNKLENRYSRTSVELYQRLSQLFAVIDQGSDQLNMPAYNGGLFSQQSESGAFLTEYAIPDCFLALGLDRLTRDVDDRTKALVFIDFKSLGVRQLGSIYEGLLEFRLQLAAEPLAVTKEKGKEVFQPLAQVKKPLAVIAKDDAYLENDKRERKATGSYYTPDYIVKYIVQHTVGPVLDRAFAALTPRLRTAQKSYREYAKLAAARQKSTGKAESAATFWNNAEMQQLRDDCLNIRVVDPAMGSGHFLVEVVDYVSNRLISFLNGWSENPVWALVETTREDILAEMERQHVSIDADRLTRVALLKRAVLKRCVYGVDLNGMAVELAKVSLWLDAFTLGAPLSFLDHHLKHGNSLIGARIGDVQTYLEGGAGAQSDMFSGSKFAGVMLATDLMRQVSYQSDNTVAQASASAAAYRDASDHLAPFKRLLDVYTSRWFGNQTAKKKSDAVRLFLQEAQTESWLRDPTVALDDRLIPASQIATTATAAAAAKRFFHWQLEFPEVFFAPATPGSQDVQLRDDGGFDAVVGNPPYGVFFSDTNYLYEKLPTTRENGDVYVAFLESCTHLASPGIGQFGLIIPLTWQTGINYWLIRKHLVTNCSFKHIINLPYDIFPDAYVDTGVFTAQNTIAEADHVVHTISYPKLMKTQPTFADSEYKMVGQHKWLAGRKVIVLDPLKLSLLQKASTNDAANIALGSITISGRGILADATDVASEKKDEKWQLFFTGHMNRYEIEEASEYVLFGPNLRESPGSFDVFTGQRMLVRRLVNRQDRIMAVDTETTFVTKKDIYFFKVLAGEEYSTALLTALINSQLLSFLYLEQDVAATKDDFRQITLDGLRSLPIRRIAFTTPADERAALVAAATAAYAAGDTAGALAQARSAIGSGKTDVVHDLLAHLAQRMIDLNKQKQAETKRFLGGLETRLAIKPNKDDATGIDSLPGKSILQNYGGDYQKNERERSWRDFFFRLYQNRNRFNVALGNLEGQIAVDYDQSLATLLPIKRDLARTDALIDKIVYRLYGLSDDEIELIERPQYQQALAQAKASVVADETLTSDDDRLDQIGENVLQAAEQFFARVEPTTDENVLDADLPGWRDLPPHAPTFLRTAEYNLRTMPDDMDFSASVLPYTKAVEVTVIERIFAPFRNAGHDATASSNTFLKGFLAGTRHLTLGNFGIILASSSETALRAFVNGVWPSAATQIYGAGGAVALLNDSAMRDLRNKAAHDEAMTREEAQTIRSWAMRLLALL